MSESNIMQEQNIQKVSASQRIVKFAVKFVKNAVKNGRIRTKMKNKYRGCRIGSPDIL